MLSLPTEYVRVLRVAPLLAVTVQQQWGPSLVYLSCLVVLANFRTTCQCICFRAADDLIDKTITEINTMK